MWKNWISWSILMKFSIIHTTHQLIRGYQVWKVILRNNRSCFIILKLKVISLLLIPQEIWRTRLKTKSSPMRRKILYAQFSNFNVLGFVYTSGVHIQAWKIFTSLHVEDTTWQNISKPSGHTLRRCFSSAIGELK